MDYANCLEPLNTRVRRELRCSATRNAPGSSPPTTPSSLVSPSKTSVVYDLLILQSSLDNATVLFHYVGLTITLSIALHSLTDLVAAR